MHNNYEAMQKSLSYVRGNPDDFDYNSYDWKMFDFHKGSDEGTLAEFKHRFYCIILYHSNLYRDVPPQQRDALYYAKRYAVLFEDLYRLYEHFPHCGHDEEYRKLIRLHEAYRERAEAIEKRRNQLELDRIKARADIKLDEARKWRELHPHWIEICPRCHRHTMRIGFFSSVCSTCNYETPGVGDDWQVSEWITIIYL